MQTSKRPFSGTNAKSQDLDMNFWTSSERPQRIEDGPLKYQVLRSGIRRAMTRRFPYAIYFSVEEKVIVVLAISMAQEIRQFGSSALSRIQDRFRIQVPVP